MEELGNIIKWEATPQPVTPDPRATPAGEAESVVILLIKSVCRIYHT